MSPSACKKKTEVISVVCSLSLKQLPQDVKALEEKIVEVVNQAGRDFYGAGSALPERWSLSDFEQVTQAQSDATALALGGKTGAGSGHRAQLSAGGGGAVALDAGASKRVANLALCAISRSEVKRAA